MRPATPLIKKHMRALARNLLMILGSWYHHFMASRFVWWHIRNRRSRKLWQEANIAPSPAEARMVARLNDCGIAIGHVSEFFPSNVFEELSRYAAARWDDPSIRSIASERAQSLSPTVPGVKKSFLVSLWKGDHTLDPRSPFLRYSLSDPLLHVVGAYLEMYPKFRDWRLEVTVPTPEGMRPRASQRWHRDQEDQKLVKVFLYLNDVDENAGPFMYVKHAHPAGKWRDLFPRKPPRGSLPMPENVDDFIPWPDVEVCTGKAGTIVFCDTSGLHQGGYAKTKHRLMYTSIYTTSGSPWPIRYRYPENFTSDALSAMARFAVENNPHQRAPKYFR